MVCPEKLCLTIPPGDLQSVLWLQDRTLLQIYKGELNLASLGVCRTYGTRPIAIT
jgi:hypothetical protein